MPSRYQERLHKDLDWIKHLVADVGFAIGAALTQSVRAVLTLDRDLAAQTILGDFGVNRQAKELDRLCHVFVARHLPSAGLLRYVSSVLRLGIALERIGDYSATISRTAAQLSTQPPAVVAHDIEMMASHASRMLTESLRSFVDQNVSLAQATLASAAQFTHHFNKVFADLVSEGEAKSRPANDLFGLMAMFNRLERVIHQAKNICGETIFVVTGRTKGEKEFDLLFVDEHNDGTSQLAEHFTRKAYPQSGKYRSAGWNPAEQIDPDYVTFGKTVGIDLSEAWPNPLAAHRDRLDSFDFIIGFAPEIRAQIGTVPFHTTILVWDIDVTAGPEQVYRLIAPRLRELMERLRGEQAG